MNLLKICRLCIVSMMLLSFESCKEDEPTNSLIASREDVNFESEGGSATIFIETDATDWLIQNRADWITVSPTNGTGPSAEVTITVSTKSIEDRSETLNVVAGKAELDIVVSQTASEYLYAMSTDFVELTFNKGGSASKILLTTDAPDWQIASDVDWLSFSPSSGSGDTQITVTGTANTTGEERSATISITAEHTPSAQISADQIGEYFPSYNTSPLDPDATGMDQTAVELASNMTIGWNIGNTLEAIGGETAWGNPKVTGALIDLVKANGFNSIRIPCSWDQNLANPATAEIKQAWLDRVKEVVQLCADRDMYTILNIHWDGGWLENNVTPDKKEINNAKQKALWEQIATHLRDFDEHLIFAGTNEPNVDNATQMAVLKSYLQTFIDAVRSTGGKNTYRTLVVQGPSTDFEKTNTLMTSLPTDTTPNRMMAEVHFYTPYPFCLMTEDADWGSMFYYWGADYHSTTDTDRNATWGEEATVDQLMGLMKTQFVNKGIPVILGEYGAMRRSSTLTGDALDLHLASRVYYLKYVTQKAIENGLIPFYWDEGGRGNNSMGLFNRSNNTVFDQQAIDAINEAAQ